MTEDDLRVLIADVRRMRSESDNVEVKAALGGTPRVHDSLSALANRTGGGTILFGLDERQGFAICGVHDLQRLQEELGGQAANEMEPPIRPEFAHVEIEGKIVVAMTIPETPYHLKPCHKRAKGWQNGAYTRVGGTDRRMTAYEIYGYLSAQAMPEDDCQPVRHATVDDLDPKRIEVYIARRANQYPDLSIEQCLVRLRLAVEVEGIARPTLACLLMFGAEPERFERQLVITFLHYYGTTETEKAPRGERFLDNREFSGPIPVMVEDTIRHILGQISMGSRIGTIFRVDVPEYPEEAIREAVINAVAHRDYSAFARGSYVQVRLFADRLEIQSPGGLFGNVSEETLDRNQSTRNRELMHLMQDAHVVENRGTGIRTMIEAMLAAKMEEPRFADDRTSFLVTFSNASFMDAETMRWLRQFAERDLTADQRYALAYLRHHQTITNAEYQTLNRVNYPTAHRDLQALAVDDFITLIGSGSNALYFLSIPIVVPTATESKVDDQPPQTSEEKAIAFVREHGSITNEQCRTLLSIQRRRASVILGQLVEQGLLRQNKQGRSTQYVLV